MQNCNDPAPGFNYMNFMNCLSVQGGGMGLLGFSCPASSSTGTALALGPCLPATGVPAASHLSTSAGWRGGDLTSSYSSPLSRLSTLRTLLLENLS